MESNAKILFSDSPFSKLKLLLSLDKNCSNSIPAIARNIASGLGQPKVCQLENGRGTWKDEVERDED